MMRLVVALLPLTAALLCTGCPEPELEPGPDCSSQMPGDTSMLPQRELELGEVIEGSFTPWSEGQEVNAVYGFQGFPMLTPWFELPAQADDQDGACWHVLYQRLDANGNVDENYGESISSYGLVFSLVGGVMQGGPLFHVVGDGDGEIMHLRATVSSAEFVAVDDVSIVLRY